MGGKSRKKSNENDQTEIFVLLLWTGSAMLIEWYCRDNVIYHQVFLSLRPCKGGEAGSILSATLGGG